MTKARDNRTAALTGMALTVSVLALLYGTSNALSAARGVTVFDPAQLFVVGGRSLDSRIPYMPWTIVIYVTIYGFYLLPVVCYPKTESGVCEFFKLCNGLIVITLVASAVFVLCPAEMVLRATAVQQDGALLLHDYNVMLHAIDAPFNTWPCLHVAQPGLIFLVVARWLGRRYWSVLLLIVWVVLAISTLTVRQHFIWDIITGSLLALGYWCWQLRSAR